MWECPNCKRTFNRIGQSHYCGAKPKNIDEYISRCEHKKELSILRDAIRKAIPDAEERISWSMPTYWKNRNLIQFAEQKNHLGLYPGPEAVLHFEQRLKRLKYSKGSIQIPYDGIDLELIKDIAAWCYENNQ